MRKETTKHDEKGLTQKYQNKLITEKSPYLLQHAENPVDWYPWRDDAFTKAKEEDKPIFLSIGYSTCHWCHVMAHESFQDEEVAKMMNETFISIKVDREERPDIDRTYMTVCQILTGSGGWPLTIIMTPDKKPFFAGTYFPKENRFGRIGMLELIPKINELWKNHREDLLSSADQVIVSLQKLSFESQDREFGESMLTDAYEEFVLRFDELYGGFSNAPKFPTPHNLLFLLRYWKRTKNVKAKKMVETTLDAMLRGGIYDHIGFGFHRYSIDSRWLVPHFEKMLYDQALFLMAFTEAYQVTGNEEYARVVKEIITYVVRDMTSPDGGFYSAEDADSEGMEGKFYTWTEQEIIKTLDKEEADLIIKIFNISKEGNYHEEATGKKTGKNILSLNKSYARWASHLGIQEKELRIYVETARRKLFYAREKRIHPQKDDKILTDWNG